MFSTAIVTPRQSHLTILPAEPESLDSCVDRSGRLPTCTIALAPPGPIGAVRPDTSGPLLRSVEEHSSSNSVWPQQFSATPNCEWTLASNDNFGNVEGLPQPGVVKSPVNSPRARPSPRLPYEAGHRLGIHQPPIAPPPPKGTQGALPSEAQLL